jgi:hypothetical protein
VPDLFNPSNPIEINNSNLMESLDMNKRTVSGFALAFGGVIITLAFLDMFYVTDGPGWAITALLTACATLCGLIPSLRRSPLNTLSFGFSGSLFTCMFLYAYHLTSGAAWGIFALVCATLTICGLLIATAFSGCDAKSPD